MRPISRLKPMFFKLPPPLSGNKIFSIRTLALSSSSVMLNKNKNSAEEAKSIMVINKPSEPEQHVGHYERNFITAMRAMQEFHLKPENLVGLRVTTRRSPSENTPPIKVYWRKDVEAKSIQVWGSLEEMELEKQKIQLLESSDDKELVSLFKRVFHKKKGKQKQSFEREFWPIRGIRSSTDEGLSSGSGKVVLWGTHSYFKSDSYAFENVSFVNHDYFVLVNSKEIVGASLACILNP